ncbi:hypothetical protein ACQKPX_23970 [Photobacterium sp. DNB23_23_1]
MIYVHIGLHKTATTSLQSSVFNAIEHKKFIGRNREGVSQSDILYKEIMSFCHSEKHIEETAIRLKELLNKSEKDLILSDEWLTSDYSEFCKYENISWQDKLKRLSSILPEDKYKILVTLREPLSLSYSQYCEFHKINIKDKYKTYTDYVLNANESRVFDYVYLNEYLSNLYSDINYLTFDSIKNGKYKKTLQKFFSVTYIPDIIHENKKSSSNTILIVSERSKIYKSIASLFPKVIKDYLRNNKMVSWVKNTSSKKHIIIPEKYNSPLLKEHFHKSIEFYEEKVRQNV